MKKRKHAAAKKAKKAKAKTRPKTSKAKKAPRKEETGTAAPALFEEIILNCANCGKKMRLLKVPEFDPAGMLCSSCSKGEIELPQE